MSNFGVPEYVPAQGDKESGLVPEWRGHVQVALPGTGEYIKKMDDADQGLEIGAKSVQHHVRGAAAELLRQKAIYTKSFTGPQYRNIPIYSAQLQEHATPTIQYQAQN